MKIVWSEFLLSPAGSWAALTLLSSVASALGAVCMLRFYFRRPPRKELRRLLAGKSFPGVTIIKPCFRNSDNEEENFDIFFNQDYQGPIQLIFAVSHETDPIVPVVKEYLARYPQFDASLLVSNTRKAFWRKVDALYDSHWEAKHDLILWSDSDVVVERNYVTLMVACLQEPGISVVTTPQYDFRADNLATGLKVLGNNADLAAYIMYIDSLDQKKKIGWGHSMGFRKSEFDSFGPEAWRIMNTFLADDQALPYIFTTRGKKVVFRNIYCPVQYSGKKLRQVVDQKRRFVWCQRIAVSNRYLYVVALLIYGEIPALVTVLLSGFATWSLWLFALAASVKIAISFAFEALFLRSIRMNLKYFWTIPFWDLMQIYFILDGFFRKTIRFDGKVYRVVDRYFLEQVEPRPLQPSMAQTPERLGT